MSSRGGSRGGTPRGGRGGGGGGGRSGLSANEIFRLDLADALYLCLDPDLNTSHTNNFGHLISVPLRDESVHDAEEATLKNAQTEVSLSNLSLNGARLPLRPGYGAQGAAVLLWANYMTIALNDRNKKCGLLPL